MEMALIIKKIEAGNVMSEVLGDLIKDHMTTKLRMLKNFKRYAASKDPDGVPILSRKIVDESKINNKINNSFDGDIVDVKLGYMIGNPVIYTITNESESMDKTPEQKVLDTFNKANYIEDLDGETLKMATICGYGSRLLYIDKAGLEKVVNIKPWECIYVQDGSLNEVAYAMRYYDIADGDNSRIYVEWYDRTTVWYYISAEKKRDSKNKLVFLPYAKDGITSQPHQFTGVPLIKFKNNEEELGDCDRVYSLIDGYDITTSDVNSELAQLRMAYMAFYGLVPDAKTMAQAKQTGAFGLADPTSRVEFITKALNDTAVENHLNRLEENIYKFAKSVNFSDEAFGGNVSGIAMKFKMFGLVS